MVGVVWKRTSFSPPGSGVARGRHVADGHFVGGNARVRSKRRLVVRLIPARDEAPCVRGLELGEQRARVLAFVVLVIEREQAVRLRVDLARIGERQPVGAGRSVRGKVRVAVWVSASSRDRPPTPRSLPLPVNAARAKRKVGGIKHQLSRWLDDVEVDGDAAIEGQLLGVRRDGERIMVRDSGARQLGRNGRIDGVGLRLRCGGGGGREANAADASRSNADFIDKFLTISPGRARPRTGLVRKSMKRRKSSMSVRSRADGHSPGLTPNDAAGRMEILPGVSWRTPWKGSRA